MHDSERTNCVLGTEDFFIVQSNASDAAFLKSLPHSSSKRLGLMGGSFKGADM